VRARVGGRADHSRHLIPDPLSHPLPSPLPPPMSVPKMAHYAGDNGTGVRAFIPPAPPPPFPYPFLPSRSRQKFDTSKLLIPFDVGQKVPCTKR
jgi:hypothetical protein